MPGGLYVDHLPGSGSPPFKGMSYIYLVTPDKVYSGQQPFYE